MREYVMSHRGHWNGLDLVCNGELAAVVAADFFVCVLGFGVRFPLTGSPWTDEPSPVFAKVRFKGVDFGDGLGDGGAITTSGDGGAITTLFQMLRPS